MELALTPFRHREREGSMHTAQSWSARRAFLPGDRGPGASTRSPRRLLDRASAWGYGSANITCDACGSGTHRRHHRVREARRCTQPQRAAGRGGAINGWSHSDGSATETMTNLTASLYAIPAVRSGAVRDGAWDSPNYHVNSLPSFGRYGWGAPPARVTTSGSAGTVPHARPPS